MSVFIFVAFMFCLCKQQDGVPPHYVLLLVRVRESLNATFPDQ